MSLTLIKGARQSGKSTWILNNLKSQNVVLTPSIPMTRILLERYVNKDYANYPKLSSITTDTSNAIVVARPELGATHLAVFAPAQQAGKAIEFLGKQPFGIKAVFLDEINLFQYRRLERIIKHANEWGIDIYATFTPVPISPKTAHHEGWLQVGQWYKGDVFWLDLPPYGEWDAGIFQHAKQSLRPANFTTDFLGEFVIEDDDTPPPTLPVRVDFA